MAHFLKDLSQKTIKYHTGIKAALLILAVIFLAASIKPAAAAVFNVMASGTERKLPIYSVDTPEKVVALTFDAAWGADDTDTLIAILGRYNIKATFFLCGYWVDKYPDEVKKLYDAGHDIGNHSATHPHGNSLSLQQNENEISLCGAKIMSITGQMPNLFRPPFGEYNNTVIQAAENSGYYAIQWDVDTLDIKIAV